MDVAELTALLAKTRESPEGVKVYRVSFAWADWYAKRASVGYVNGDPVLVPVGPVAWDMSTALHPDSPTLTMGEEFVGPLTPLEVQVLTTGHSDSGAVTNPRWKFTVEPVSE